MSVNMLDPGEIAPEIHCTLLITTIGKKKAEWALQRLPKRTTSLSLKRESNLGRGKEQNRAPSAYRSKDGVGTCLLPVNMSKKTREEEIMA